MITTLSFVSITLTNHAYILERSDMTITGGNQATEVAFKNCVPFLSVSQKFMEQQ